MLSKVADDLERLDEGMSVDHREDGVVDERGRKGDGAEIDEGWKGGDDGGDVDGRRSCVEDRDVNEEGPVGTFDSAWGIQER